MTTKASFLTIAFLATGILSNTPYANGETLSPIIYKFSGTVSTKVQDKEYETAFEKKALASGTKITTATAASALIAVAPGVSLKLKDNSSILTQDAVITANTQSSQIDLLKGAVLCILRHSSEAKRVFKLAMGNGEEALAIGTSWQSYRSSNEKQILVATGTVSWAGQLAKELILIGPGCLMIATYEEDNNVKSLIVLNLRDGSYTEYPVKGGAPVTTTASQDQLDQAREKFQALVNEIYNGLPIPEQSDLRETIEKINEVLKKAGLNPIVSPAPEPPPPGPSNNPSDEVTPVHPQI